MNSIEKNKRCTFLLLLCSALTLFGAQEIAWPKPPQNTVLERKAIPRQEIFPWLMGMSEKDFCQSLQSGSTPKLPETTQKLMDNIKHARPTLGELKKSVKDKLTSNNGTLSILYLDVMKHPETRLSIDIGSLQVHNPGAVFQIASRPSGLEGTQMAFKPNKEKTISEPAFSYQHNGFDGILGSSAVQGEEAAISSAIKTIHHIYMANENTNLFANIGLETNPRGKIQKIDTHFLESSNPEDLSDNICVDFFENVPVTTGGSNVLYQSKTIKQGAVEGKPFNSSLRQQNRDDANMLVTEPCFISQVNVSAIDLSFDKDSNGIRGFGKQQELAEKTAMAALKAAYEATLYCAIKAEKRKVFLTLVGCGAFRNKLEWIADILDKLTNIIKQSGLDITLVAMDANGHLAIQQKEAWDKIQDLAAKTGGTITDVAAEIIDTKTGDKTDKIAIHIPAVNLTKTNSPSPEKKATFLSTYKNAILSGLGILGLVLAVKYYLSTHAEPK